MGQALRRSAANRGSGRRAVGRRALRCAAALLLALTATPASAQDAPERLDRGRFAFLYYPHDRQLASSLADYALRTDSFPGLPLPAQRVTIAIAPDRRRFREWAGAAPEWGSAVAFPESRRIVIQGQRAGSDAGDPLNVLRHELAHLVLHEFLGDLPPRWFDEGYASYAAREWGRDEVLMTNVALVLRGMPTFDELEDSFGGGSSRAQAAYALSYRAVAELANLDRVNGLSRFFSHWQTSGSMERAMRRAYGMTVADFERRWRQRTRRQYGALALLSNLTMGILVLLFAVAPLYVIRKRRDRQRLDRMRAADEAAERAQRSAIDDLLGNSGPEPPVTP